MAQKQQKPVDPRDIFTELAVIMAKHGYQPTEEETKNVLKMRGVTSVSELGAGVVGGVLMWNATSPRLTGSMLPVSRGGRLMLSIVTAVGATGVGGRWAGNRCLQMLAHQPGPMGGEVCELIRQRDPESPLLRNVPSRMEGDPLARITPWRNEGEGDSQDGTPVHNSNPAINMPNTGADTSAGAARNEGSQEHSHASADWGDMGEFSMAPLEAPAFSGAEESQQPEQRQQHSHTTRRSRAEERRHRRQQHQGSPGSTEELQDYFDHRWDEPPPK